MLCHISYSLSFCSRSANLIQKPWCLLAFGTPHELTVKTGVYIYLAITSVKISNRLYLTTVYDEVNDPNTSVFCFSLQYIDDGRCSD